VLAARNWRLGSLYTRAGHDEERRAASHQEHEAMRQWRDVIGFEGRYIVSDLGDVRSMLTGRYLRTRTDRDGYMLVTLSGATRRVHRLVAEAFLPNPEGLPEVDHRNHDRSENSASNLRWASVSTNRRNMSGARCDSESGERGVRYRPEKKNPWQAYATYGRFRSLGHFATKAAAVTARRDYEQEHANV
jgi:hypothetical protein